MKSQSYVSSYLAECAEALTLISETQVQGVVSDFEALRHRGGRLFILGNGGSAAQAAHAVNDARKLLCLEAYSPVDNVAELTARINDEGWISAYSAWLRSSRLCANDLVMVFSVGGGDKDRGISANIVCAIEYAVSLGAKITGIVGRDGGFTAAAANSCILVPTVNASRITGHVEGIQAILWHLLVFHPLLQQMAARWEGIAQ